MDKNEFYESESIVWSSYRPLGCTFAGGSRVVRETLEGGQSFRWNETQPNSGVWIGVIENRLVRVRLSGTQLEWSAPHPPMGATLPQIQDYFAISKPFDQWVDDLPWRSDPHLRVALNQFRGLRILQQNVGETLLCFLLSPLKRIPQIREGFVTICSRFGERLLPSIHTTPSWDRLATLPEALLRACGIGYRAKSIAATARFLAEHPNYLEDINTAPTVEAQQLLEQLPGVGSKIASCVLLFGLGRMEAFPVDTWIQRTLCATYSLEGFTLSQIETFARAHFGQKAGLAQQFLFASIRESARKH